MAFDRLGRQQASSLRQLARRILLGAVPAARLAAHTGRQWSVQWTFDDGPDPEHTPPLLDLLARYRIRAAFFMIGSQAERHPALVRRIAADGHLVGSHSWSHPAAGSLRGTAYLADVRRGRAAIEQVVGQPVTAFRPPHGYLDAGIACRMIPGDWQIVLWSVDPKDYLLNQADVLSDRLSHAAITARDIVLLHDTGAVTAQGLELYLTSTGTQ